jgi:hypothetical protein
VRPAWELLGKLEEQEARLHAWGVVDGAFAPQEVEEMAREFVSTLEEDVEWETLVEELLDQRLLVRMRLQGREVMRTRMAETVRLFARMRQLFPRRPWRAAPTLVADYRFALRPRRYPERNRPFQELLDELRTAGLDPDETQAAALQALATHRGELRGLAGFQIRAAVRAWRDLKERRSRGMIVGAGTGTGKTLAFYLPALGQLVGRVRPDSYWTKAIALYPRNELLKDQFAETFAQARKLDRVLADAGTRKLRIGAYYGQTPYTAAERDVSRAWNRQGAGYVCPFLRCPGCGSALLWLERDVRAGRERLVCGNGGCRAVVLPDEVVLTRDGMRREPPDVLFTTAETLNIRMTDSESRHLFGIDAHRPPVFVLLDEVHTYSGVHGAQVAYVLRRWRKAIGNAPVQFTGLSATLPNATEFFAQLVGLPVGAVEAVAPLPGEMETEGVEYVLALRGDPASRAALLSTTIQATMLLRRVLDVAPETPSEAAAGTRVFVFADDLDVTNRLYHNLLDAEGLIGTIPPRPKRGAEPLAALRAHRALPAHAETDPGERLSAGQSWYLAEQVGHGLHPARPLRVGRTTSQDSGVGQELDVVVATASLEVGYNDPEVGAVVQHKAPREVAAYLQRKGRAGRDRRMRPWTVIVLSDYGRDRTAYQSYEQLFDPSVETRTLPIGNRHVLRMQAAFALMDWMADHAPRHLPVGHVWRDFSSPAYPRNDNERQRQGWEAELLRDLLKGTDPAAQRSLEMYLASALQVTPDEVRALLWEPPRALMTSVLPTLLRRLETRWGETSPVGAPAVEPYRSSRPLPEYVPENLFSDLDLPEVVVELPPGRPQDPTEAGMPILQAMRTLAPGRVTRRFAPFRANVSHWIPLPDLMEGEQDLPVQAFCPDHEALGPVQLHGEAGVQEIPCYRPWRVRAAEIPAEVGTTSNAFLQWRSQLSPADEGEAFEIPAGGWDQVLTEVRFFVHALHSHVQVRRFALGSEAQVKLRDGGELDSTVRFVTPDGAGPACVGYVQESDGMVFRFRIPDAFRIGLNDPNGEKLRAFRTAYFRHRVLESPALSHHANFFERERLAQVYLSALTARALEHTEGLEAAAEALREEGLAGYLDAVLSMIFQTRSPDAATEVVAAETAGEEEGEEDPRGEDPREMDRGDDPQDLQKAARALRALTANETVTAALHQAASVLWAEPDDAWDAWARERFTATLGGALLEAWYRLCPQAAEGDLLLDLDGGPRPPDAPPVPEGVGEIWITEATLGGGGLVEALLRQYAEDPRRFFLLARSALGPSDFEIVDAEMTRLLESLSVDGELQAVAAAARNASTHHELQTAVDALRDILTSRGILTTHPVMSALHARVLRPASSPASDAMLLDIVRRWREAEERLGVEIDGRVFAYVASSTRHLDAALAHVGRANLSNPVWRFGTVYGLLWPRGGAVRARALASYNPFASLPEADRAVLLDLLQSAEAHVRLGQEGWRERLSEALASRGAAHLFAAPEEHPELRTALLAAVGTPIDVEYLHLYPQIEGVERTRDRISIRLHVREVLA